jgi:branched-chain amino acid transport system permease protein
MRLSGMAAGIATFSLLVIVQVVIGRWTELTNGAKALSGVPITTTMTGALVWAIVAIFVVFTFQESRTGLRLRAAREDEVAARAIGVGVVKERLIAFTLGAFFFGAGGVLLGHFLGGVAPSNFYITQTFVVVAMLVVGGINSLSGAVVGTLFVSALGEGLIRLERGIDVAGVHIATPVGSQQIGYAIVLLVILILRPGGLMSGKEVTWPTGWTVARIRERNA